MAEETTAPEDYWLRAVKLFTGYGADPRPTLFDEITGNHGIKQMKVEITKQDSVDSVTGEEYDWMSQNAGWDIENTDFVIPFYTRGGNEGVTYYKARFTLLGSKTTDGVPKGGEVTGSEGKSKYGKELEDGHFKPSDNGTVWNTFKLTKYSFGTGRALGDLLDKKEGTIGFTWGGEKTAVPADKGVRLDSFDLVADSFDRVAGFFWMGKILTDEWQNRVSSSPDDAWKGQAAGVFWDLVHELRRRYDHYSEDMGYVVGTSKQGRAVRQAGDALRTQARSLHNAWSLWKDAYANPLRFLSDLLAEIAQRSWYDNLTQVDAEYEYYGETGAWDYTPRATFTSQATDKNGKTYGDMSELDTWKKVGDEAILRWEAKVKTDLWDPAEEALRNLSLAWSTSQFDLGSISTKGDKGLGESFKEDKAFKAKKDADDKAAKDKADADAKYEKDKKEALDKAAKDKADADAKYERDKKEALDKAAKDKAEADAKYEKEKKEALDRDARAKAEADAKQAQQEAKQEQIRKDQEAKQAEREAKQEAKEKEQEAKQAEREAKQEAKEKEQEAKQEQIRKDQEKRQAEQEAKQDQIRAEQEKKQEDARRRAEEKQEQAQAIQIQQVRQQKAEQEKREKEQERKRAEQEAKQEAKEKEQEARQDQIRKEQEAKQTEQEARQEQLRKEQETKQDQIRKEQEQQREKEQKKQEEIRAEQERKQEEREERQEEKQAKAEARQEQLRREQEAKQDQIRAEQEKRQDDAQDRQDQIRKEQEARQDQLRREQEAKQDQIRAEQEKRQDDAQDRQDRVRAEQEEKQKEFQHKQEQLGRSLNDGGPDRPSHDTGGPGDQLRHDGVFGPVNGDDSLTNPGGSVSHLDPRGRVVTDFPDGGKTVIDPHTQMSTVIRPDGTSYSGPLNAGDSLTNPDGSRTHIDPQGQVVTDYPDGSSSRVDADTGATSLTSPDGTTTTGYLNDPDTAPAEYRPGGGHQLNGGGPAGSPYTPTYDYGPSYEEELYDDSPYREPSLSGAPGGTGDGAAPNRGTPLNSGPMPGMGGSPGAGGMPMGGMPMGGAGGQGGNGPSERVRNVIDGDVVSNRRPGAAPQGRGGRGEQRSVTTGGTPFPSPTGAAGGPGRTETESGDRDREVWEPEDDDVWGTDEGGAPAVIGR